MASPQRKLTIYVIFLLFSVFHRLTAEKPVIIKRPTKQNVYLNQSATFICRVRSALPLVINWSKSGGPLLHNVPGSLAIVNDSLTFLRAQLSDDGIYKCIAENSAGTSSAQATLRVLDLPVAPTITEISSNKTIVEGKRVTLTCKASGNPLPMITWRISIDSGDDRTPQLERPSSGFIRIPEANSRYAGRYLCIAENPLGNDTRAVYLKVLGRPVFIVSPPSSVTVNESTTVRLSCRVIGSPVPDVMWYYGDQPAEQISNIVVLDNNTLLISDVKFNNSGRYTCRGNNSAGLERAKTTLLQVLREPKLTCCADQLTVWKNQTAVNGKSVSLRCSATGYPKPQYQWMFENKTISSSSVFTILNVSQSNAGSYFCNACNNLGEVSLMIHLNVLVPPKVLVQPKEKTVVEGERVKFICTATGVPSPKITWYGSGGFVLRNNSLVITNVSANDKGSYYCEAKNKAGKKNVRATLVLAVRPTFLIQPRNVTVNETSTVNIQCEAKGPDQPSINWFRLETDGQKINLNHSGNRLTITKVNRKNSGFYVCEARNVAGFINTIFFINVQYRPRALTSEQKVSIVAGKQAILHCPINANPSAEIWWIKPVSFAGPRLTIATADVSHAGQYSCKGSNILGTIETTFRVEIMTTPRIVALERTELESNFVSLTCVTMGTPQSSIDWLDLIPVPSGFFSIYQQKLHIHKGYINTMKFVCNASNVYGWTTKFVRVPSSPQNVTIAKILSSSVTFSWLIDSKEIISRYIIERRAVSDLNWVTINSSVILLSFTDRDLSPFTTFTYRVSARNVLGTSRPGGSFYVTTSEGVPSSPSRLEAKSVSLTSITLVWDPPGKPQGQLTSIMYEVYYREGTGSTQDEIKISVNQTVKYQLRIDNLKSNSLYIINIRAGRLSDGLIQWSNYRRIRAKTLQKAPTAAPKEIKGTTNGPRRIYVTWESSRSHVKGYKLEYKVYESTNMTTTIEIKPWNKSSYMITGLIANRYYEIRLNMFTTGGDGPWSLPIVVHTDQDRLALPAPIASSSDSLPWKIAVGGAALAVVLLLLLLVYVYLMRKNKHDSSGTKKPKQKSRNQGRYDFTDNASRVSNESEGSTEGVYNVNTENDIDLSMFDHSHHTSVAPEHLYVENPILPTANEDSDDSNEAVRLATFIARPSPLSTPYLTGHRQISASHVNPAYHPDEEDMYTRVDDEARTKQPDQDSDIPVYAQVDLAAKKRDRRTQNDNVLEQFSDDVLI